MRVQSYLLLQRTGSCASLPGNEIGSGFKPQRASQPCCFHKDVSFPEHLRKRVSLAEKQLPALGVALLSAPTPRAVDAGALLWSDVTCGARPARSTAGPLRFCLLPEDNCAAA